MFDDNGVRSTRGSMPGAGFELVAAVFTPFAADGSVDLGTIERQAVALARQGLRGAFVCGTSGEGASLSTAERLAVARRWCEVTDRGRDLEVIVHVGHTSVAEARVLAADAERAGAAAIAAVAPFYFRPRTTADLVRFCAEVAAAAPDLPFFYYHIPSLTGVLLPVAEFLIAAASAIPSLGGVKFTAEDLADYARCLEVGGDRLEVFFGRDEMALAALALGARSGVGTTYNFAGPLYGLMAAAFAAGDVEGARGAQGVARRMIEAAGAAGGLPAFKAMMPWFGIDCGPCRTPLATPSPERMDRLRAELEADGFFAALAAAEAAPVAGGASASVPFG